MAYYNPRLQFFRAILNAIRSFFRTIVSRKLLYIIIITMFIMLLHLNTQVHAETLNNDNFVGRTAITPTFDPVSNAYNLTGTVYNQAGRLDVNINVPSNMWQGSFVIVYFPMGELSHYMLIRKDDLSTFNTLYFNYLFLNNELHLYTAFIADASSVSNLDSFKMNMSTGSWFEDLNNVSGRYYWDSITPCNIIFTKDCNTSFTQHTPNLAQHVGHTILDYTTFETPSLSLTGPVTEFTLNLKGFSWYGQQYDNRFNDSTRSFKYQLEHLYYTAYDYNTNSTLIPLTDIINDISVTTDGYDDITGYPIQSTILNFYRFFPTLQGSVTDQDVLVVFTPIFKTTYRFSDMTNNSINNNWFLNTSSINYWRYKYNASTLTASLVAVDSNGDPIQPEEQPEENNNATNEINNFLQDDEFNTNTISGNMPSSSTYNDVTASGFDNIFTTLRNTFTSNNYTDFVFTVPFTNGKTITIPSTLTENIIPQSIKSIIQMVYWFMISRFILKDIASYIEKAKSGDIFTKSDTNIKTDML